MSTPRTDPIRSADQMRARLAEVGTPSVSPIGPPLIAAGPVRVRYRERVALLDYFRSESLEQPRSGSTSTPATTDRSKPSSIGAGLIDIRDRALLAVVKRLRPDLDRVRPGVPTEGAQSELNSFATQDCELVTTREGSAWRLRLDIRRATLKQMGPLRALSSLTETDVVRPAEDDITHRMAWRLLGGPLGLRGLSPLELSGTLRAVEWLAWLGLDLPSESDILAALDLANVLAPLRAVATPEFIGREQELALLRSYLFDQTDEAPAPLAVHGPGGVGKSTLLAKFVLDHVDDEAHPMLFAYLSFDRSELDPQFPLTLLGEICRQVALQSPLIATQLESVRQEIDAILSATVALRVESTVSRGSSTRDSYRRIADEDVVIGYFASALSSADLRTPFLVVLDTFEVAQRRRRSSLHHLAEMLQSMRRHLPDLRIVVAGRAEVTEVGARDRSLNGLDITQATALLRSSLSGVGVKDNLVRDVAAQVSGNPLSLRLAADLMHREGPRVLATRRGRRKLLFDLTAEQVQGVLYRRILDHVAPAIRPLANPGLVVRQITPAVIAEVLAEPCGLGSLTNADTDRLFELLRADVSLVTQARPGVLVHRADVRREMLPLLDADDHERVVDIHRRAIRFYGGRPEIDDQIEHLYHRLMLGEPTSTLDGHWRDGLGPFLEASMPELPPESRVYLAAKLNIEADRDDLRAADQTAWVRQATRQSRALLDAGQPHEAWLLLTSKPTAPRDLAISRLIVESLASQGNLPKALLEVREALADADRRGLTIDLVQLTILGARVAEDSGLFEDALDLFAEARESAEDFGAKADCLTAGAGVLRLLRRGAAGRVRPDSRQLREKLIVEAGFLTDREKAIHPGLLRELAAELGSALPALLADASARIGVETEGESASQLSPEEQSILRATVDGGLRSSPTSYPSAEPSPHPHSSPGDDPPAPPITSSASGLAISDAIHSTSDGDGDGNELRESLSKYWQSEADRPNFDYDAEPPESHTSPESSS